MAPAAAELKPRRFPSRELCVCVEEENPCLRASGMAAHAMEALLFPPHSNDPPLPTGQRKGATSWLDTSVGPVQTVDNPSHTF